MAKARRVKGLRAKDTLQQNARRIALTRLAELYVFAHAVHDPTQDDDLHNLRIAAKRLRYSLEIFRACYGPDIAERIEDVKAIQEQIGEIHDCDVLMAILQRHLGTLAAQEAQRLAALALAGGPHEERMAGIGRALEHAAAEDPRPGILSLLGRKRDERKRRYKAFVRWWDSAHAAGLHGKLYACIAGDPLSGEGTGDEERP